MTTDYIKTDGHSSTTRKLTGHNLRKTQSPFSLRPPPPTNKHTTNTIFTNIILDLDKATCTLFTPDPSEYTSNLYLRIGKQCTTHGNAPKGYRSNLRPKTHIQHTHPHNLSTRTHTSTNNKSLTVTGWGKQNETPMATYKAVMRPTLEYATSILWSPLASSTSINKLQVMQNAALTTATGCTQDQFLKFDDHITAIYRSTHFHIRNIDKIRNLLSYDACSTIIHALISCRLDYCNSILYNVPKSKTDRLQRFQNQCARILIKSSRREHITTVLKKLHWLKIQDRIIYKILMLTYKSYYNMAPPYLCELINKKRKSCEYSLGNWSSSAYYATN